MKSLNRHSQVMLAALFSVSLWSPGASATNLTITACNQSYTSGVNLVLDPPGSATELTYDHDDPPCVVVKDGYNFDMNSYKIRCVPGAGYTTCANPAVVCQGTSTVNSVVQDNDANVNRTNIEGPATIGVLNCGTVQKIKIDGAITGISVDTDGKLYQKNVVWPSTNGTAMNLILQDNADRVTDNRIDGGNYGIRIHGRDSVSSVLGPMIDHNVIRAFRVSGITDPDPYNDVSYMRVQHNAIVEGGVSSVPMLIYSPNASFDGNACEAGGPCECELNYLTPEAGVDPPSNCF